MQPQQQQSDPFASWKRNFNITYWLVMMHGLGVILPARKWVGMRILGTPCALALALMVVWAMFTGDQLMWLWIAFWFVCYVRRRKETSRLVRSGARLHSETDGYSWDAVRWGASHKAARLFVEPVLAGIAGGALYYVYQENDWNPTGLPYFFLSGLFSLPFVELVRRAIWERKIQSMNDARVEQEAVVRDYRERYGE
jgi:hypothetical protein